MKTHDDFTKRTDLKSFLEDIKMKKIYLTFYMNGYPKNNKIDSAFSKI